MVAVITKGRYLESTWNRACTEMAGSQTTPASPSLGEPPPPQARCSCPIPWGQQGPRSPVLTPEPKTLNASCPPWKAWLAWCVLNVVIVSERGPKRPGPGASRPGFSSQLQPPTPGAVFVWVAVSPSVSEGWGGGTGLSPRSLPVLGRGLPGERLPEGGELGGRGLGVGTEWKPAFPFLPLVCPTPVGAAPFPLVTPRGVAVRQGPALCSREGADCLRGEVAARLCAGSLGLAQQLLPGSAQRGCSQHPPSRRKKLGIWSLPFVI